MPGSRSGGEGCRSAEVASPACPFAVSISAADALLLAGLRRVAASAGLQEVQGLTCAALSLRSGGVGKPHGRIDVELSPGATVIRVTTVPSEALWRQLLNLIEIVYAAPRANESVAHRKEPPGMIR